MKPIFVFDDDAYAYAIEIGADKICEIRRLEKESLPSYSIVTSLENINSMFFPRIAVLVRPESKIAEKWKEDMDRYLNRPRDFTKPTPSYLSISNDTKIPTKGYYRIHSVTKKLFVDPATGDESITPCALMSYKSCEEFDFVTEPEWYRINALIADATTCPIIGNYKSKLRGLDVYANEKRVIRIDSIELDTFNRYYSEWVLIE